MSLNTNEYKSLEQIPPQMGIFKTRLRLFATRYRSILSLLRFGHDMAERCAGAMIFTMNVSCSRGNNDLPNV